MKTFLLTAGAAILSACNAAPNTASKPVEESRDLTFVVIGDTPYDAKDEAMLAEALPIVRDGNYPFVIHLGDYKGGGSACEAQYDQAHQDLIQSLNPVPVFYTPGDNEWTDCDRRPVGDPPILPSEKERLETIRSLFFSGQQPKAFKAKSQAGFPENQSWSYQGILFATLHVVATNNGRSQVLNPADIEWAEQDVSARDAANLQWLKQAFENAKHTKARAVVLSMQADMTDLYVSKKEPSKSQVPDQSCGDSVSKDYLTCDAFTELRAAIRDAAKDFEGPVIVIHGDSSPFTINQAFSGQEAPNLWRLNAAGDAGERGPHKWGTRDVTVVTLSPEQDIPVSARGLLTNKKPKAR